MAHEIAQFRSAAAAHRAARQLRSAGFEDVGLICPDVRVGEAGFSPWRREEDVAGALGAAAGGLGGGAGGALAAAGAITIPGLGAFLALGPLAGAITGALTAASAGGIIGTLIGYGLTHHQASACEASLKRGHALVVVRCGDRCGEASRILADAGADGP